MKQDQTNCLFKIYFFSGGGGGSFFNPGNEYNEYINSNYCFGLIFNFLVISPQKVTITETDRWHDLKAFFLVLFLEWSVIRQYYASIEPRFFILILSAYKGVIPLCRNSYQQFGFFSGHS